MELIFASHNLHKLEEVRAGLAPRYSVTSLQSLGWSQEIPETQDSLYGNALLKARTVFQKLGRDCFADDTGLEINALGGRPGVHTARFAGEAATAQANRAKVQLLMKDQENRQATFRTVIVLILNGREYTCEGSVSGQIATEERGLEGFGYDPLFIPMGYNATYAEMPFEQRNQISHRSRAITQLRNELDRHLQAAMEPNL